MFAGHDESTVWRADQDPVVHESADEGDSRSERQQEAKLDADDRTPEEAGYGYGV